MSDIFAESNIKHQRLTQKQKDANNKKWYKEQADMLDNHSFSDNHFLGYGGISEYKRKKVNYDLFNNRVNIKDMQYVVRPFGEEGGELPANMVNRDIVSTKIKVLLGMEMSMPFGWKVIAVNPEATSRKEQEETKRIKEFVSNEIMKPLRLQKEREILEQTKGRQLTQEEQQQIQQQIEEELRVQTPDEVKKYMKKEHQDPAEDLARGLLQYLIQKERVNDKFNKGWKHSHLAGEEIYHVGIYNGEPGLKVVNNLYFDYDKSPDLDFIEDGEWAVCEYRMTPSQVVSKFGNELKDSEIDKIYQFIDNPGAAMVDSDWTFDEDVVNDALTVRVLHCTWKSLMKIGFLIYKDDDGEEQMSIVDENYKFNEQAGDIEIQWEWIPETHEVYKIMSDIYVLGRPVPGQHKDLDNLWEAKLPYYGAACDNLNSPVTAAMDRMKSYQHYYNIILYRIELLMASDKGKILMMNIGMIPKSSGINTKKWMYFLEANKIGFYDPKEEGSRGDGAGAANVAKEVDMSLASDIDKYIKIAEYIEIKCGASIGVTKAMEGAVGPTDAVQNARQNLTQASHIVRPYFELHNVVKGNVLKALLETAKVAYSKGQPKKLSYVLDDMSLRMLTVDQDLLDSSSYGLFITNSGKAEEAKQAVVQLAQAAMQNQQADLEDIAKLMRAESMEEVEELLALGTEKRQEQMQASEKAKLQADKEARQEQMAITREGWKHEEDMILLKAKEDRRTKLEVAAVTALGFNEDKDMNDNRVPDVLEVAEFTADNQLKNRKLDLDERKFEHDKENDAKKLENDKKKLQIQSNKNNSSK